MIRYWGGPLCGHQVQALDIIRPKAGRAQNAEARPALPPFEDWVTGDVTYPPLGSFARYVAYDWCDCGACVPRFRFVELVIMSVSP